MRKNKALNKGREKLCEHHGVECSRQKMEVKGPREKRVCNSAAAARKSARLKP